MGSMISITSLVYACCSSSLCCKTARTASSLLFKNTSAALCLSATAVWGRTGKLIITYSKLFKISSLILIFRIILVLHNRLVILYTESITWRYPGLYGIAAFSQATETELIA